jgi:hypothetical protein
MPTNRTSPERPRRRPSFDLATLELFCELNALPKRRRHGEDYLAKSKRLSNLLNLNTEWWGGCHVEHSSTVHPQPREHLASHHYWETVQEVRRALLAELERSAREAQPAARKAFPAP